MINRLYDLKDDEDIEESDKHVVNVEEQGFSNKEMEEFMNEVKIAESEMKLLQDTVSQLRKTQAESLGSTSNHQSKMILQRIGRLVDDTRGTIREVKQKMTDIEGKTKELKESDGNTALVRIREQQHSRLMRDFVAILQQYHEMREEFKQSQTDKVTRQVKIVNKNATDEEVAELLQKQSLDKSDVFKSDILTGSQQSTVEAVYAEVLETHRDICELEKQFYEVHELFRDFALLVQQQDSLVDNILLSTQNAVDYVEKGTENLVAAKSYQKKSRSTSCILLIVILVVAIIAGAVVVLGLTGSIVGIVYSVIPR